MANITLRFACGCQSTVDVDRITSPTCPVHGAKPAGVVSAPAPTFRGHARGPHAQTVDLGPKAVTLATTPLILTDPDAPAA